MDLDKNTSCEDSENETPFSEISETDSQYLKRRTLQKRVRNSAPGSGSNSPNKKKTKNKSNKSNKPAEQEKSPPKTRSKSNATQSEPTAPSTSASKNTILDNNLSSKIPKPQDFSDPEPPPVFVSKIENFVSFGQEIAKLIGQPNFRCFSRINDIKINTNSRENYKKLISHLTSKNYDFHCYQLKQDKAFRVVLRGLHSTTPISVIKTGLEEIGHNVRHIAPVLHPRERYPLPLFFIDLEPAKTNNEIFQVQRLVYSTVRFEEPRQKPLIVQCTKCQNLGHTKTYCHHEARCVKCAGFHASDTCQRPKDEPATCALCGEAHPASYRGCEVYKNLHKQRSRNLATKTLGPAQKTCPEPPEIENQETFPALPTSPSIAVQQQPSISTLKDYPQQNSRNSQWQPCIIKKQPQSQAPQTSQSKPKSSNTQPQQPRQPIPPHQLPLRVKLPPEHPHPAPLVPTPKMNLPSQVQQNLDPTPRTPRRTHPPPSNPIRIDYSSQPHDLNPLPSQTSSDINSILSSFLIDLQQTIKPLITLLTRLLSEIPFNFR